ncbi:UvrB/UvrC protein [Thermovirga lienii DSM 17291]|uniref:UvrB/UvrC protein n=1 Tax=Thermovirga lienii (strain ATCC BAA-1197 / DSM 17291 / Cas60314) TaxID=580340 RepID=G7V6L8_THELD|nr:UvrB/UvrC motif-containing protein [Thermovirga lienii]AER67131.1 UvrB/UvrC protein [Thermovirga lienii DSM 17291]
MRCERCNENEATLHIKHMQDGVISEYHLCQKCAQSLSNEGIIPDIGLDFKFGSLLGKILSPVEPDGIDQGTEADKKEKIACPNCGIDLETFRKVGKFGCAECYRAFERYLGAILRNIHGCEVHRGARPGIVSDEGLKDDLQSLKTQLKMAVEREEYERAAELRDRIKMLEERGNACS